MSKISLTALFIALFFIFIIGLSNSGGRANISDAGNTGAPCEDGLVCRDCHLGGPYGPVTQSIALIDPLTGLEKLNYAPGKTYNVEIQVVPTINASRYGFQATVLDSLDENVGIWLNPSNAVQISTANISCNTGSRTYIEHKFPNFVKTFRIDWKAPSCDVGAISFYYIGNAVNNDGSTSGDVGGTGSVSTYPAEIPHQIVIDSSNIFPDTYIASGYISATGAISDSSTVILGANDSVALLPTFDVHITSELSIFMSDCIED